MYLERYRRTKVSNILRSVDGRVLPAVHADGSIVSILAIVTRADGGDSSGMSGNMLFKGVVQRVDAVGKKEIRAGFRDQDVLEIDKTGIIKYISPSVLPFLNYPKEMSADSFAGKPVEFLIPKIENRPTQDKGYWIPKCLAAGDLNFYILLMNKNLSLTPFTMSLQMKSADTILIRLKDISNLDALITIDDLGVILAFNEDAFLLLGHDPDEALGQNIKFMLAPEISVQHDFFLQRYKDTRVARVVGVARTLNTIHRDKSVLPIEIQVTELNNGGVVTFIGRIRHTVIEDRISQGIIPFLICFRCC
jgi:PAS domain S-box-containing protein